MKRKTLGFIFALAFGLTLGQGIRAQERKEPAAVQRGPETQLAERFARILDETLESEHACFSLRGAFALEYVLLRSANMAVQDPRSNDSGKVDENLRIFARTLLQQAKSSGGRITDETIARVLGDEKKMGLCPLFPICK